MNRKKTNKISIFKIKRTLIDKVLGPEFSCDGYECVYDSKDSKDKEIKLFIQKDKESIPAWYNFIKKIYQTEGEKEVELKNKTNSFILLQKYNNSLFAVSGGNGYLKLNDYIDKHFGLELALRLIEEESISYINQTAIRGTTRQIQRSVVSYNPKSDKDNFNRILHSISGKGYFEDKKFSIYGKSSIVLRTEKDIDSLDSVFQEIEETLESNEIKKIDSFNSYIEIEDKKLIYELDNYISKELIEYNSGKPEKLLLNIPYYEYLECDSISILYSENELNSSLDLKDICWYEIRRLVIEKEFDFNLSIIKNIKIKGVYDNQKQVIYSLYDLILFGVTHNNNEYIKIGAEWYELLNTFKDNIDKYIKNIEIKKNGENPYLPDWDSEEIDKQISKRKKDKSLYAERIYNTIVSEQDPRFCLLDRKFIQIQGKSKIEPCDLYDKHTHTMIHVKKTWASQASYLFSQAYVSAESYCNDLDFKGSFEKLVGKNIPDELPEIVIAIAIEKSKLKAFPINLSYFAKLALYNMAHEIRGLGYKLSITPITIT